MGEGHGKTYKSLISFNLFNRDFGGEIDSIRRLKGVKKRRRPRVTLKASQERLGVFLVTKTYRDHSRTLRLQREHIFTDFKRLTRK